MVQAILLYDEGCKVCTAAKDAIEKLDGRGVIEPLGLGTPRARELAVSLAGETYWSSFHLVRDGRVWSASDAFEEVLSILPATKGLKRAMDALPPVRSAVRSAYRLLRRMRDDLRCLHRRPPQHGAPEAGRSEPGSR